MPGHSTRWRPACCRSSSARRTKFIQHVIAARKAYRTTIAFGGETATGDREGDIIRAAPLPGASRSELDRVLTQFIGRIRQIPPSYSAIKRDGVPLYKLARQGELVEAPEREVVIERIDVLSFTPETIEIDVVCGSGTYIRSLGVDIARALDSAAHLTALRRLWVSPFEQEAMIPLETLSEMDDPLSSIAPIDRALVQFARIEVSAHEVAELRFGRKISDRSETDGRYRLYDESSGFIGLGLIETGVLRADRLMATS
jgi:tRNA pseudouridine55 synthase